ncbi:hypothetical protein DBR32_14875 [Taibaiella sp. KBW10]|nr:hypothetical protein DBR32_14875 [Taibaiella sp. KBW10]
MSPAVSCKFNTKTLIALLFKTKTSHKYLSHKQSKKEILFTAGNPERYCTPSKSLFTLLKTTGKTMSFFYFSGLKSE